MTVPKVPFDANLLDEPRQVKIVGKGVYDGLISAAKSRGPIPNATKAPYAPRSLADFPAVLRGVLTAAQTQTHVIDGSDVILTTDNVDFEATRSGKHVISLSLKKREPAGAGNGKPFNQEFKNYVPTLREQYTDPEDEGYKVAVFGKFYDNLVCMSIATTSSHEADVRASWLEDVIESYEWYFNQRGIKIIFLRRNEDKLQTVNDNKIYIRPLEFYVRTEKLRKVSQKVLEELVINI